MTTATRETGQDVAHEKLTGTVTIGEAGYVYIYFSNEEGAGASETYWDDLKVTQIKSSVVAGNDYYPFGLTFNNSYARENSLKQDYLYNGKELQDELNLGWLDYGARMYMSDIGRWGTVDPLADKMRRHSPYNYTFDNPIRFIDPDGRGPGDFLRALGEGLKSWAFGVKESIKTVFSKLLFADDIPKDNSPRKKIDGNTVTIVDDKGADGAKNLPKGDTGSKNHTIDKSLIDALGAAGESLTPPSPTNVGETIETIAGGAEKTMGAVDAASGITINNVTDDKGKDKSINVKAIKDTVSEGKNFNQYQVTTQSGKDSVIQRTNSPEGKKNQNEE